MYGRAGELLKLGDDRNDERLSVFQRRQADKAYHTIVEQLKDRKLMGLRLQLIKATQAGDSHAVWQIECQMKEHEGRELEASA